MMATFFGEVLPIYSRAVEEDEDDNDILEDVKIVQTPSAKPFTSNIDTILIAVGRTASLFAKGNVLGLEKTSTQEPTFLVVKNQKKDDDDHFINGLNYRKENLVLVSAYSHPGLQNTLVLLCETYINPEFTFNAVNKVFEHCKISKNSTVFVVTSENWTSFRSTQQLEYENFPILRILPNTHFEASSLTKQVSLEQPNFLTGIAASALTECEVTDIPAVAIVCYENESSILALELFRQLFLSSKLLKNLITVSEKIKVKEDVVEHGNLYG